MSDNDKVKEVGLEHEYTAEEAKTLYKCSKSFAEFAKHIKIVSLKDGLVPFRMYDYQEEMVGTFADNKFTIVLSSRQSGKCVHGNTPVRVRDAQGTETEVPISTLMHGKQAVPVDADKFVEEAAVEGMEVSTPDGWKPFRSIAKTKPFRQVIVRLHSGKKLYCADDHLLQRGEDSFYAKHALGKVVDTCDGVDYVTMVEQTDTVTAMYDLCDVEGSVYYTNGISSHNSTTVAAFALWFAMFNPHKGIGIVSNKASSAQEILYRIKDMYESIPAYLKPGAAEWNKLSVEFENKTRIQTAATSKDSFRGRSMNIVICDELAFVPPGLADEFWTSNYPVISTDPNAKIMVISTPNGMFNLFHKLYSEAWDPSDLKAFRKGDCPEGIDPMQKNSFVRLKYDWRAVPGRDEEWERETRSNMNDIKFSQEYEVNFLGSTATVVSAQTLGRLLAECTADPEALALGGRLRIYEEPSENCIGYVIGVDPAKGTGKHDATMQVLKVTSVDPVKMKQVAVFQDNNTDPHEFSGIVDMLSKKYNNARIIVENNGEGSAVVHHLWWTYESENMYSESAKRTGLGLRATAQNKSKAVILMKRFLEDKNLEMVDKETVKQLATFIEDDRGSTHGQQGKADDLISGLYWAVYSMELEIFDDVAIISRGDDGKDYEVWGILADHDIDPEESFDWLNY